MSQHDTLTLEPCPFCGNEAHFVDDLIIVYASCPNCGATGAHSSYRSGAAEAWNRRAALSATQPAQAKQPEPAEHWHRLYLEKCQQYNDRVAQLGGVIEGLEAEAAQGEPVPSDQSGWCAYVGGMVAHWVKSAPDAHARLGDDKFEAAIAGIIERRLWALRRDQAPTQPAAGADVLDAGRYRWLRTALADRSNQGKSHWFCRIPEGAPSELDSAIDAAIAASGRKS